VARTPAPAGSRGDGQVSVCDARPNAQARPATEPSVSGFDKLWQAALARLRLSWEIDARHQSGPSRADGLHP